MCDIVSHARRPGRVAATEASRKDRVVIDPLPSRPAELQRAQAQDVRAAVSLPWLTRLRWGGVAGQLLTVAVGHWTLGLTLPVLPVLAMIGICVLTNLALVGWVRGGGSAGPTLGGGVLALDPVALAAPLHACGRPVRGFALRR